MNESNINENSTITGKNHTHKPFDIVYRTDRNYIFKDCIAVFWYIKPIEERVYFKVEFYDEFTEKEFNDVDCANQTVYLVKAVKEDSEIIIKDIESSLYFEN
ncbi:hypothetical protein [Flavobacterium sp. 140616W15]|uniref:hypothetical protein n=1 Tax=Flavobacterium sp. 140616W15 TaxID=2478552 RepID=UPI000F0C4D2B|nr:hypothetical protein [Flavobacterium sp. 140616W15]AYN04782.1 hypothetical protein EAG11_11875 [Flavobacterium sp. 140616W15]